MDDVFDTYDNQNKDTLLIRGGKLPFCLPHLALNERHGQVRANLGLTVEGRQASLSSWSLGCCSWDQQLCWSVPLGIWTRTLLI